MKNGLAIWHYPHRTICENIEFFAKNGFEALSVGGGLIWQLCSDEVAETVKKAGIVLTAHTAMPYSHEQEDVEKFQNLILEIGAWQEKYGLISILSFDVAEAIRGGVKPYIDFVLEHVKGCRVALEDFGLNERERAQIEYLKGNERFGYLIDIGHMHMRIRGEKQIKMTLFTNSESECPKCADPGLKEFAAAFASKEFPIFEIHLHNNDGVDDLHLFLEDGRLDISIIWELLKSVQYDGIVTIESAPGYQFPCYNEDADNGILRTFDYWKSIMNK